MYRDAAAGNAIDRFFDIVIRYELHDSCSWQRANKACYKAQLAFFLSHNE